MANVGIKRFFQGYIINIFHNDHLINPLSKNLTKKQQITCVVSSIALGILTLGTIHLFVSLNRAWHKKNTDFKEVELDPYQVAHIKNQNYWKTYPESPWSERNFSYVKPQVKGKVVENVNKNERCYIEQFPKENMRKAMQALDSSLVDSITSLLVQGELARAVTTLDKFSNRIMDLYEAYVEVQRDENIPIIPGNIGVIKSSGFSHEEILKLKEPCLWYAERVREFHDKLAEAGLSTQEMNRITEYIASNKYTYDAESLHKPRKIRQTCVEFCNKLAENKKYLKKIIDFDGRVSFTRPLSQAEKEELKSEIAFSDFKIPTPNESALRLLEEVRQRFLWRDREPGYVGSPLRLMNIVRGKHDNETYDAYFRTKLFFIYGSKSLVNEIVQSSETTQKINARLAAKKKGWQLDEKLATIQRKRSKREPVYKLGTYSKENNLGEKTRELASHEDCVKANNDDPNHTFATAERIAKKETANKDELLKRFRFPLYEQEEMAFFGTTSTLEEKELERKYSYYLMGEKPSRHNADTGFHEAVLDYQKKITQIHWIPGKHFFKLHGKDICNSPYLHPIQDLNIPQYSAISGSTDQTFTMAGIVGVQSREELMDLRLLYIPWMGAHEDHTADEIMTAAKSFGLPYTPAPDYYKQIYPELEEKLTAETEKAQRERGFELPDYYLEEAFALEKAEALQDQKTQQLMRSNRLFLHGCRTYRENYSLTDLFGDKKWESYTDFLTDKKIKKVNEERLRKRSKLKVNFSSKVRYDLNFQERRYEPNKPSSPPFYQGTHKESVTLVPPLGKTIPYVPFDLPHLNRVGLLFDANACQHKPDKFVFKYDANVDIETRWKKSYTKKEIGAPGFEEKAKREGEAAADFNRDYAHQISMEELIEYNTANQDKFLPYNELNASLHNRGIVGIFTFSRGLPKHTQKKVKYKDNREKLQWPPLHHESVVEHEPDVDYDRYMLLMGIGKKIATLRKFGIYRPLYLINETTDTGLTLVPRKEQIALLKEVLANRMGEQDGIIRIIKHQTDIRASSDEIRKQLVETLKRYLEEV